MNRDIFRTSPMAFLKLLEDKLPRFGGHHSITYCRYGSDESGWEDKLGLHIRLSTDKSQTYFLDNEDLDKPIEQLVDEVVGLVKNE